jgi:hypothetical protein
MGEALVDLLRGLCIVLQQSHHPNSSICLFQQLESLHFIQCRISVDSTALEKKNLDRDGSRVTDDDSMDICLK